MASLTPLELISEMELETPEGPAQFLEYSKTPRFKGRNVKVRLKLYGGGVKWFKLSQLSKI